MAQYPMATTRSTHMQKSLTFMALSTISNADVELATLFKTLLTNGYGAALIPDAYTGHRVKDRRSPATQELLRFRETQKRCRALLNKLERKGFIHQEQKRRKIFIHLTQKGTAHLIKISEKQTIKETPLSTRTKGTHWTIVIFDIPEEKRSKRNWIRRILHTMGFAMLQRSVWASQAILPKAFMDKIAIQGLAPHIKILEITNKKNMSHFSSCSQ